MRLYHFISEQFGLEAIRDKRIKIARINELNDPFEFQGLALRKKNDRKLFRKYKNQMNSQFGLICMSMNWQHPLLWSHYADKHRGLCLGFDISWEVYFEAVNYQDERLTLENFDKQRLSDIDEHDLQKIIFTKFKDWEYEAEWRHICPLNHKDAVSDLYFFPFSDDMKLAEVIVGERSELTREKLASVLGEAGDSVTSFRARSGFKKFQLEENKNRGMWK